MSTVDAPYPSRLEEINDSSVSTLERDADTVTFKNRAGVVVGSIGARNLDAALSKSLVRIGSFDFSPREVVVKGWYHPNRANKKLSNPATLPAGACMDIRWSPDEVYLAVASASSPYLLVYKRTVDSFSKIADPAVLPGNGAALSWSPNGKHLLFHGVGGATYNTLYSRSIDTLTKVNGDDAMFGGASEPSGTNIEWSPDALLVVYTGAGNARVFKRSTRTSTLFVEQTLGLGTYNAAAFSPTNNMFALLKSTPSPYLNLFSYSGGLILPASDPAIIPSPGFGPHSLAFSPDGRFLAVGFQTGTPCRIYDVSAGALTQVATTPNTTYDVTSVAWHPSGKYVYFGGTEVSGLSISGYEWNENTHALSALSLNLPGISSVSGSRVRVMRFSPSGRYLAVGFDVSPYFFIFKTADAALEGLLVKADEGAYEINQSTT